MPEKAPCRACGALRPRKELIHVFSLLGGPDFFVCRPSIADKRDQCFRTSVMGADIQRIELAV